MSTRLVVFKVWDGEPDDEDPSETSILLLDPLDDDHFETAAEEWADQAGLDDSEWHDGRSYVTVEAEGVRKKVYLVPEYSVSWIGKAGE